MQDLENAVRDALQKAEKFQVLAGYGELYHALGALSIALAEHEAKPKVPANAMAHIELLQGSLNIANQDLVSAQNRIDQQREAIAGESKVSAELRAELAKANAEIVRLQGELGSANADLLSKSRGFDALNRLYTAECKAVEEQDAEVAQLRGEVARLQTKVEAIEAAKKKAESEFANCYEGVAQFRATWAKLKGMLE